MFDRALEERSKRLTARVEALAVALHESGVSEAVAARVLAHAAAQAADEPPRRKPSLPRAA